jgi:hypothetical protein
VEERRIKMARKKAKKTTKGLNRGKKLAATNTLQKKWVPSNFAL